MFDKLLLATTAVCSAFVPIEVRNTYKTITAYEAACFVKQNLSEFVSEMKNASNNYASFAASSIEFEAEVPSRDGLETYYLLDFDKENGHALFGDNLELLSFEPEGQLASLKQEAHLVYDRRQGFFINEEGVAKPMSTSSALGDGWFGAGEDGLDSNGAIVDLPRYLKTKFNGEDYNTSNTQYLLPFWSFMVQRDYAWYFRNNDDGTSTYEGNCLSASIYFIFHYLASVRDFPLQENVWSFNPAEDDPLYSTFSSEKTSSGKPRYTVNVSNYPIMYKTIRNTFIELGGYTFDGCKLTVVPELITNYLSVYFEDNYKGEILSSWSFDDMYNQLKKSAGSMYIWNQTSGRYNNHSMPVIGASSYYKTTKTWIFSHTEYADIIMVNDNYTTFLHYVDLKTVSGSLLRISFPDLH